MRKISYVTILISASVLGMYIVSEYSVDIVYMYNVSRQNIRLQDLVHQPGIKHTRRESGRTSHEAKLLRMIPQKKVPYVDCKEVFAGNEKTIKIAENIATVTRIANHDYLGLTKNCSDYRRRGYITMPINDEEEQFPIAYSIQIYKDIVQIESLLMAIYRPQNWYCINVDLTSDQSVHLAMISIANCFDNIIISNVDVKWADFSQIQADLMCMQLLLQKNREWKYLLTLAGQMFPMKTNLDIVRILKAMNGSNAVMAVTKKRNLNRWNFLPLPPVNVTLVKGSCHFAVTRSFVNYVLTDNRALLFKNWTSRTKFPDEHYFQSLSHSPQLNVPGAYTGWPENGENGYEQIMRYVSWIFHGGPCHGKYVRAVCILGVGDLALLSKDYHLFVNKFYYDYQPMAMRCMEERHYNWTREDILGIGADRLNMTFYRNQPNVKNHVPSGQEI